MKIPVIVRMGTAAAATGNNKILKMGEWGFTTDTFVLKMGRGLAWNDTPGILDTVTAALAGKADTATVTAALGGKMDSDLISLDAATDLNTLTSARYVQRVSLDATLAKNYPATLAGFIEQGIDSSGYVFQRYTTYTNDVYVRTKYSGTWGAWKELAAKDLSINTQAGSYTLALTDRGGMVRMNVASPNTLTVPPNSAVAFPVGTQIVLAQAGAGQTEIVAGSGVTVNSSGGKKKMTGQYSGATLVKVTPPTTDAANFNYWLLMGDLSA